MSTAPLPPNKGERSWGSYCLNIWHKLKAQTELKHIAISILTTSKPSKSVLLRRKTRLVFGMALTSLLGLLYVTSSNILLNSLKQAEKQDTFQIVKGVLAGLAQSEAEFGDRFLDWSAWDDSYIFVQDGNQRYIDTGLTPEVLKSANLNLVVYVNSAGQVVYGTGFDLTNNQKRPIPLDLQKHLSPHDLLLKHDYPNSKLVGLILLPEGPMLISSLPIVTSQGKGPIRGTLICGRYLNAEGIKKLALTTRSSLSAYSFNIAQMPADFKAVRSDLDQDEEILVNVLSKDTIAGYTLLEDIYGQPALLLRVDTLREIYKQGLSSLNYLMASLVAVGLAFAGVTLPLLERLIIFWHERQEKEQRYRVVVEQASEAIFLVDGNTKGFLEANAASATLLGYTNNELLQLTLYDLIASDRALLDQDLSQIQTQKYNFIGEWQFRCKNSALVDIELSANLISYHERDALCIVVRNITDRKQAEEALRESEKRLSWQATHDSLTDLINRREFERRLEEAVNDAKASRCQHILCYLDLDQFKIVNDTCGHIAGDELLRQISSLFQTGLRQTDVLARLGGDEFGILLYQCPLEKAVQIANILRERIHDFRFAWQEKTFAMTVSIGLTAIGGDTQSKVSVLSAADAACYAAKNKGRNRIHIYQLNDRELALQRGEMQWVSRIIKALEENQFCLYYQKIVSVEPNLNQSEHWEILLRLQDETGMIISPMAFIPAAERYNLMHMMDRWVISTLFSYLQAEYQAKAESGVSLLSPNMYAVNLSGASINDEQFISFIHDQFIRTGIPPSIICFEITETLAITNLSKAAQLIRELKALGCSFALDDFGSGMSSFAYLKNLPVDYLKIDGAFIKDIVNDAIAYSMVEAISRIASVMGIKTIAEFVENDAIVMQLKTLKVDYAQGYGIAKPCPLNIYSNSANKPIQTLTSYQ